MKKKSIYCIAILAMCFAGNVYAQPAFVPHINGLDLITNSFTRNVGIGTTSNPVQFPLTVNGEIGFELGTGTVRTIRGNTDNYLELYSSYNSNNGPGMFLHSDLSTFISLQGAIQLWSHGPDNGSTAFELVNQPSGTSLTRITKNGNIYFKDVLLQPDNGGVRTLRFNAQNANSYTEIYGGSSGSDGSGIIMGTSVSNIAGHGGLSFWAYNNTSTLNQSERAFEFLVNNNATIPADMRAPLVIRKDEIVVIGSGLNYNSLSNPALVPSAYKLIVQDGILTEKLKVALSSDAVNWSDFVFNKDYKLMPLSNVESYVKENKHLPEVPSAKDVYKDGIDVAQMDAKLLQKIEELTLYIIQQQKEIDELKKR